MPSSSKRHFLFRGSWLIFLSLALVLFGCISENAVVTAEDSAKPKPSPIEKGSGLAQPPLPMMDMQIGAKRYQVEVASTQEQIQTGLMFRQSLPAGQGMLFQFQPARMVYFWMKNTYIPLDMIFVADGHVTHIEHRVPPCKTEPCPVYGPGLPSEWVVELPAGTAAKDGLAPLASVQIMGSQNIQSQQTQEKESGAQ